MKKIIVIGSGYSGSGAVFDYLAKRPDICDPFKGGELRLIQDPEGLMDLFINCSMNYTLQGTSATINNFLSYSKRLFKSGMMHNNPYFMTIINNFINDITAVEYNAAPYCERIKMNRVMRYLFRYYEKWTHLKGKKPELVTMRIPVEKDLFLLKAKELLDNIIGSYGNNTDKQMCVINHGGSFWKPVTSTIFYKDRKIVIVCRDARDIYAEMSVIGRAYPGRDPDLFCSWYQNIMNKVDGNEWKHPDVLTFSFEEFVEKQESCIAALANHVGMQADVGSAYDPKTSRQNIGKFKNILSKQEMKIIESKLNKYCYL